ncbi:MAG: hypothetical protein JSS97_18060 [Actinobacteria bacterium]|nr:hypothetical protein [Actinomycetota bacterium]
MRFHIKRQGNRTRPARPRIAISQDEITADLLYRGGEPRRPGTTGPVTRGRR